MKRDLVKGAAHITGGGLLKNLPRVLPDSLAATLEIANWPRPPVFTWLQKAGGVDETELLRTFNCGIGMALIVSAEDAPAAKALLEGAGETVFSIGKIVSRANGEAAVRVL
jgi:phosphoribosylformylglycinamidine cyclo-ligase